MCPIDGYYRYNNDVRSLVVHYTPAEVNFAGVFYCGNHLNRAN
jgi:hypothetical protein